MMPRDRAAPLRSGLPSQPEEEAVPSSRRGRTAARIALATLLVLLGLWVARDFLAPLAWAAVIAISCWPLYARCATLLSPNRSAVAAPLVWTLLTGVVLVVPVALAAHQLAQEGDTVLRWIGELREKGVPVPAWLGQMPIGGTIVATWWQTNLSDPQAVRALLSGFDADAARSWTKALGADLLHRAFQFLVMLIALFFLLRDGIWISGRVLDAADRLLGDPGERLARKMIGAVRGTVNGTVLVALGEGLLIGMGLFLAAVPNPLLFTLLTAAFAMLPFGAWIAFTSAALLSFAQGDSVASALVVFGWGATVMLIGDNFVWPAMVGGAARLPFLLALIGILGGLQTFGLLGLFMGPVVMAAGLVIWREWISPGETNGGR